MSRVVADVLKIMRLAIGPDEFKIYEQFGTMTIEIDATNNADGVYNFPGDENTPSFINVDPQVMISLTDPVGSSLSWFELQYFQDPGEFYSLWGINNESILIAGTPTQVLFYGNQLVFRTVPNDTFTVKFYGYQQLAEISSTATDIPFDYWMRFLAYGAAKDYAADYRLDQEATVNIERNYKRQRKLLMARTYNYKKTQRCIPRF